MVPSRASMMRCARSTLTPWYSLRSSLETWASLTPRRSARCRWVKPCARRRAISDIPMLVNFSTGRTLPPPCLFVPADLTLHRVQEGERRRHRQLDVLWYEVTGLQRGAQFLG